MTNHTPVFTSSSATGSFTEFANSNDSTALHTLSGTMSFKDSDKTDSHTTTATLHSATLSNGTVIPASSLAHFQTAMSSQILSDSNGSGQLKWKAHVVDGLENAADAVKRLFTGDHDGKLLVQISPEP